MLYFVHFELVFCCFSVFVVDFFVVHQTLQVLSQLVVLYDVRVVGFVYVMMLLFQVLLLYVL